MVVLHGSNLWDWKDLLSKRCFMFLEARGIRRLKTLIFRDRSLVVDNDVYLGQPYWLPRFRDKLLRPDSDFTDTRWVVRPCHFHSKIHRASGIFPVFVFNFGFSFIKFKGGLFSPFSSFKIYWIFYCMELFSNLNNKSWRYFLMKCLVEKKKCCLATKWKI